MPFSPETAGPLPPPPPSLLLHLGPGHGVRVVHIRALVRLRQAARVVPGLALDPGLADVAVPEHEPHVLDQPGVVALLDAADRKSS